MQARIKSLEQNSHDEWISRHIDWSNPASVATWRQAAPAFWERRVERLRRTLDVQGKLAVLKARGFPTTEEETQLLYLSDTNQLDLAYQAYGRIKWPCPLEEQAIFESHREAVRVKMRDCMQEILDTTTQVPDIYFAQELTV